MRLPIYLSNWLRRPVLARAWRLARRVFLLSDLPRIEPTDFGRAERPAAHQRGPDSILYARPTSAPAVAPSAPPRPPPARKATARVGLMIGAHGGRTVGIADLVLLRLRETGGNHLLIAGFDRPHLVIMLLEHVGSRDCPLSDNAVDVKDFILWKLLQFVLR